jgi:hypothetical protein
MATKEKLVYKVWDKKNEKYICPNGKKSQWSSLAWATEALRDYVKPSNPNLGLGLKRSPDDFEIHVLRMLIVEAIPGREAYEAKEKKILEAKKINEQIKEVQRSIMVLIPDVSFWKIRQMLENNMLSVPMTEKLKGYFKEIDDLEKRLK